MTDRTIRSLRLVIVGVVLAALAVATLLLTHDKPRFLSAAQIDPALLAAPPAEGSTVARAELVELHAIATHRTPARYAQARLDGKTKNASIFAAVMGPGFDLDRLPATAKLMKDVRHDQKLASSIAKDHFGRKRPWVADKTIESCSRLDMPRSSYPSSHTALAYSMAAVLADVAPDRRAALMTRAADYGYSRMVCGMHFRSDVEAGRILGERVALDLLANPAFRKDLAAAAAEMKAAGVTR